MQTMIKNIISAPKKKYTTRYPEQNLILRWLHQNLMGIEREDRTQVIGLSSWAVSENSQVNLPWIVWFCKQSKFGEFSRRYHKLYGSKPTKESAVA